jgi:epoxyqueuosine reductase
VLDASRCISYLTIELREPIPLDLRERMGDWLFGCDVCQDVCPWNGHVGYASRRARTEQQELSDTSSSLSPRERVGVTAIEPALHLIDLFTLTDAEFRQRFRHTPLWRPKRRGILRNAAIVLGNHRTPAAVDALIRGLNDEEPLIRGACTWALGRYDDERAAAALRQRRAIETDHTVLGEIDRCLGVAVASCQCPPGNARLAEDTGETPVPPG